jgi:DNA invertase Pin-like site-specific DNA recombinase
METKLGRPLGTRNIPDEDVIKIIYMTLTGAYSRREIAEKVNHSTQTVWIIQKKYIYTY